MNVLREYEMTMKFFLILASILIGVSIIGFSFTFASDPLYSNYECKNGDKVNFEHSFKLKSYETSLFWKEPSANAYGICLDFENQKLEIFTYSNFYGEGFITIKIPRDKLDSKDRNCEDEEFSIYRSGKHTTITENKTAFNREVTFNFQNNDRKFIITGQNSEYSLNCILKFFGESKSLDQGISTEKYKQLYENLSPEFKTPKQQVDFGFLPQEIKCKEGLNLIFKSTDGSPACVKPESIQKLIERGWAKSRF